MPPSLRGESPPNGISAVALVSRSGLQTTMMSILRARMKHGQRSRGSRYGGNSVALRRDFWGGSRPAGTTQRAVAAVARVDPTRLLAFGDDLRALLEQSFRTGGDICAMVNTESAKIDRAATFGAKRCRS